MVDFTREEVETALEEYASTLAEEEEDEFIDCLLYTSPSPRD